MLNLSWWSLYDYSNIRIEIKILPYKTSKYRGRDVVNYINPIVWLVLYLALSIIFIQEKWRGWIIIWLIWKQKLLKWKNYKFTLNRTIKKMVTIFVMKKCQKIEFGIFWNILEYFRIFCLLELCQQNFMLDFFPRIVFPYIFLRFSICILFNFPSVTCTPYPKVEWSLVSKTGWGALKAWMMNCICFSICRLT